MRRVAIEILFDGDGWIGGINYLSNLLKCVQKFEGEELEIVLLAGRDATLHGLEKVARVIRSPICEKYSRAGRLRRAIRDRTGKDYLLYALLRSLRVDVLSHSGVLWAGCRIKSLPWIADFQHRHLPEFFNREEIEWRDKLFGHYIANADALLLSSYSAAEDYRTYYSSGAPARVLQFASVLTNIDLVGKEALKRRYGISRNWFHLPNQLWKHKNHEIVIDALKICAESGGAMPLVVVTGPLKDWRNPDYYTHIETRLSKEGLQDDFKLLGKVPYEDMASLMHHSIALINPSLFEGWSTTVEEAKSIGKKVILSNIPVHLEQSPPRALYFDPANAKELAEILLQESGAYDMDADRQQMQAAAELVKESQADFAHRYKEIVNALFE